MDAATHAQELAALQQAEIAYGDAARGHMEALGHSIADMDECEGAPDDQLEMMDRFDDLDGMMDHMMDGHGMAMCSGHHGMDDHHEP